jgi:hypothetical protein
MVGAMVLAVAAGSETGPARAMLYRVIGKMYSFVIGPGTMLTLLTGIALTMTLTQGAGGLGMWVMQVTGLLAGVLILFAGLPTATKLARLSVKLEEGGSSPAFERTRKRLVVVAHVAAVLTVLSLYFGTAVR